MEMNISNQNKLGPANFMQLEMSIEKGEASSVKKMLSGLSMREPEKNYLIDVAKMNKQSSIMELLKNAPVRNFMEI
ncbi:hypothetical protein [uncultured Psychromonas sp.]|uniref:hypothetical protein n=1 Tax=uncultured Psychromonas sp. TaxID=173974 RepID=UPI00262DED88|nr:hypothetical protein [uncultured Psychromonas sp.]